MTILELLRPTPVPAPVLVGADIAYSPSISPASSPEGRGALARGLGVERRADTGRGLFRVVRRC